MAVAKFPGTVCSFSLIGSFRLLPSTQPSNVRKISYLSIGYHKRCRIISPRTAHPARTPERHERRVVLVNINFRGHHDLLHAIQALNGAGLLLGLAQGRQQQRRQNGNDGDDHQEFDEGESTWGISTSCASAARGYAGLSVMVQGERPLLDVFFIIVVTFRRLFVRIDTSQHRPRTGQKKT
jgi:hypothetical protein